MPAAFLAGKNTVKESVEDELIGRYLRKGIFEEILPTLELSQTEKEEFAEAVLERFQNPFIKHRLLDISLNSVCDNSRVGRINSSIPAKFFISG